MRLYIRELIVEAKIVPARDTAPAPAATRIEEEKLAELVTRRVLEALRDQRDELA